MSTEADLDPVAVAKQWLGALEQALADPSPATLAPLFRPQGYWRDLVAFTDGIRTVHGVDRVVALLAEEAPAASPRSFQVSNEFTPPSVVPRGDHEVIEVFFDFETSSMNAKGVVRLVPGADGPGGHQAHALMTAGQELKGCELPVGARRDEYRVDPHSDDTWPAARQRLLAYDDRDPEVLVVGAGQSGLMLAAFLRLMGVPTLVVDRHPRIGDNWRTRYESLSLHNPIAGNVFPFASFPTAWPQYLPKDTYGDWLEFYARSLDLPVWSSTSFLGATYDEADQRWTARLSRGDEGERTMRPAHVVVATGGTASRPNIPDLPGIDSFTGPVLHSSRFTSGRAYAGQDVIVVGAGTSAHDTARDLHHHGARVTMVQRSPVTVASIAAANIVMDPYETMPYEELDLMFNANDVETSRRIFQQVTQVGVEMDRDLIAGVEAAGFRTSKGLDDAGYFWDFLQLGGGYYLNTGTSDLIIEGAIAVVQSADVASYGPDGARMVDGSVRSADAVILATGYKNQQEDVRAWFGDGVADAVGRIWGYGEDGEMRNTWRATAQPGLWIMSGGIPQVRNYARYLALQLKVRFDR